MYRFKPRFKLQHSICSLAVKQGAMINESEFIRFLLAPKLVRQLALETENYEKRIKQGEKDGNVPKNELNMMWMDTVTKKDLIKSGAGLPYEPPLEVTRIEKQVLIKLFRDLSGCSWSRNFGWVGQGLAKGRQAIEVFEVSSSLYDGIETTRVPSSREPIANVTKVDFGGIGCTGKLPDSISSLEECTFLCLNWNLIFGHLPTRLGTMRQLVTLDLSCNALSGFLDADSFSQFTRLKVCNLSFNAFEGPIPDVFHCIKELTHLNLSGNNLIGEIPRSISCLVELQELKLYCNQLSGEIPDCMSSLQNLIKVNLSQNRLTGGFNAFNRCSALRSLELSENQLRGHIDVSIMGLRRLDVLYLQHNKISGILPPDLCLLTRLQRLNLSYNNIRGVLPHNIGDLVNLESLLLTGNNIIGPVPTSLANLTKLKDFHVFRSYPSEMCAEPLAFNKNAFNRIYKFGPSVGVNSTVWDYQQLYGRERDDTDNDSVTIFSGLL